MAGPSIVSCGFRYFIAFTSFLVDFVSAEAKVVVAKPWLDLDCTRRLKKKGRWSDDLAAEETKWRDFSATLQWRAFEVCW